MGPYELPGCKRGGFAPERGAQPGVRSEELLPGLRRLVHAELADVRFRAEPRVADFFPRAARNCWWRVGSGRAGDSG